MSLVDSIGGSRNYGMSQSVGVTIILESWVSISTPLSKSNMLERVTASCMKLANTSHRVGGKKGVMSIVESVSISTTLANTRT